MEAHDAIDVAAVPENMDETFSSHEGRVRIVCAVCGSDCARAVERCIVAGSLSHVVPVCASGERLWTSCCLPRPRYFIKEYS